MLTLWLLALMLTADVAEQPVADPYPLSAETKSEFQSICDGVRSGENPYFGRAKAAMLREQLERERSGMVSLDPRTRAALRAHPADSLLRNGDPEEAVSLIAETLEIAETHGLGDAVTRSMVHGLGIGYLRVSGS